MAKAKKSKPAIAAKKPRPIKNKSVVLFCKEDAKGKRRIDITVIQSAMTSKQACTLHSALLHMIVWCDQGK